LNGRIDASRADDFCQFIAFEPPARHNRLTIAEDVQITACFLLAGRRFQDDIRAFELDGVSHHPPPSASA
jgi:hypothetical protein